MKEPSGQDEMNSKMENMMNQVMVGMTHISARLNDLEVQNAKQEEKTRQTDTASSDRSYGMVTPMARSAAGPDP